MSTYLIGDVQGCYEPLQRLLEKINFDPADDKLWFCGDLVNRGGQSLEVLRLLESLSHSVSVTLGNHDLHVLASYDQFPHGNSGNNEFDTLFAASDCEQLIEWLRQQPLAVFSEQHRLLRVHAGVIPQWDWKMAVSAGEEVSAMIKSDQRGQFFRHMYGNRPRRWRDERTGWKRLRLSTNILTRLRFCDELGRGLYKASGPPASQQDRYKPWFKHKHRLTRDISVVFGHWAALGVRVKKRYISMDSGCVWGGKLSALRLEDRELIKIKCSKNK
jgi:bis(5'-nucleosyl)-tetraphosphatase (symmetrical)